MPLFDYRCDWCGFTFEKLNGGQKEKCPDCNKECPRVPSVPAWRPDYTVRGM